MKILISIRLAALAVLVAGSGFAPAAQAQSPAPVQTPPATGLDEVTNG